jgi:hypothetical protein
MDDSAFGGSTPPGTMAGGNTDFGSALSFGGGAPQAEPAGVGDSGAGTGMPPASFGSAINKFLGGSDYKPPDPAQTALEQATARTQERITRANAIASNPILQFFNPEGAQKARDFVSGEGAKQLQDLQQRAQQQTDIQKQAANFGVPKSLQGPAMTGDTIDNYLLDQYKSGDFTAANMLKARGKGDWVQDFAGAALDGAGAKLKAADTAVTKLSAAQGNQGVYAAAVRSLTPEDRQAITAMGLPNIPEKASDWQDIVAKHGAMFAQAQQLHAQIVQKLNNMTTFDQPAPKEVGESIASNVTLGNTNEPAFGGNNVKIRSLDGQPGVAAPNGSVRTDKYGMSSKDGGWSAWNAEREKTFQSYTNDENVKGALNQYNMMNKVRDTLSNDDNYRSSAGLTAIKDELGTMRDVAEKSAASGSIGFTKMFGMSQGVVETTLNKAANEYGALQNWLNSGKKADAPGAPRMERDTIAGLKQLSQHMYDYASTEAKGRLGGAMTYAGRGGKPLDEIPLDAALKNELAPFHEQGRIEAINGYNAHPSTVMGNQRVFFPQGSSVQGAQPPRAPLQTSDPQASVAPAVPPNGTPPAGPAPTSPAGSSPAGGGSPPAPVTIAGQPVSFTPPPGSSPGYLMSTQRIESGGSKNPWAATTPGSSASGAFQMIDSTWAANKPAGAPARAKDATPQQQTQAMEKFTAANAASLQGAGLPVNDANLYVAHNLGAAGATALLHADPNADARSIVGEAAARNNPMFFKGRPTAATVLQRYQAEITRDTGTNKEQVSSLPDVGAAPWTGRTTPAGDRIATPAERAAGPVVSNAPAIGGVIGNVAGAAGGVPGAMLAGAAGGVAGQSFKDWMQGTDPSLAKSAEAAGYGAVGGIAPEARPVLGAAARVAGGAGVSATVKAMEGGDATDITIAGAAGAAGGILGEGIGQLIGRVVRGNAARELGGAAEILADPHATAATRRQAMQVASHYNVDEQQLVAMRDAVQSGASRAQASLPGGAATEADASQRIAPAVQQEHNAAQHGYGVVEDALANAPVSPGIRTNAVAAATRAGMDQDPAIMGAARRLDATTENAVGRNPLQQYEAIRNVTSGIKASARRADGLTAQGLNEAAQLGDRIKELHLVNTLGTPEGPRMLNYARRSDASWRDLKTTIEDSDMLRAIGQGDDRTSLGSALLNVVKVGHAGEDAALNAVNSINRITVNNPAPRQAMQELYMREAFKGAQAVPDIQSAAREMLQGKSSSVARALLTPEQLTRVQYVADHAAEYATKRKGEAGFESALMAAEGAHIVGHALPGAGLASAAFSLVQLRGNVRMFLRSLPPNYRDLIGGGRGVSGVPAALGARAASGAVQGGETPPASGGPQIVAQR